MAEPTPQQIALLEQQLNDPAFVEAYRASTLDKAKATRGQGQNPIPGLLQRFGIQLPPDYEFGTGQDGRLHATRKDFYDRNSNWIPSAVIGGAFAGSGLAGGGFGAGASGGGAGAGAGGAAAGGAGALPPAVSAAANAGKLATDSASTASNLSRVLKALMEAGVLGGGALASHALSGGGNDFQPTTSPELQQLLGLAMKRMSDQQPLADAVNRQAFAGLPTYAKSGG